MEVTLVSAIVSIILLILFFVMFRTVGKISQHIDLLVKKQEKTDG